MKTDALATILKKSRNPGCVTQYLPLGEIDMQKPFLPEDWTQLYYTEIYFTLTDQQRLRYNQLFGGRINEFIMMLESDIVDFFLKPLISNRRVQKIPELAACLKVMIEEEERHYQMFQTLNRKCLPAVYQGKPDRQFTALPMGATWLIKLLRFSASLLPFPIWFVMVMEEEAIDLARSMRQNPRTETLGELDPVFSAVHHEHRKDEGRHIVIDKYLAEACLSRGSSIARKLNAFLFKKMIKAMTSVGKSGPGAKVLNQLLVEHPELEPRKAELFQALLSLDSNARYKASIFNRRGAALSFQLFDDVPEFADLGKVMVGYERTEN